MRSFDIGWLAGLVSSLAAFLLFSSACGLGPLARPAAAPDRQPRRFPVRGRRGDPEPEDVLRHARQAQRRQGQRHPVHAWLRANHHQFDHLIGPGRPLDTDKYFIICPDELGNTQTTFEHSTSPTNSGLKMKFPVYNGRDKVKARVQADHRGAGNSSSARRHRHFVGRRP